MAYEDLQGDIGSSSGQYVKMATSGNTSPLALTQSNVGVGTTSPAALLSVVGGSPDNTNGTGQLINTGITSDGDYNFLLVGKSATSGEGAMFGYCYSTTSGVEKACIAVTGDTIYNSLVVRKGGNVGIGWSWPMSKLAVGGGVTIGGDWGQYAAPSDGLIVKGSVGIGSTSPSCTLDVAGTAKIKPTSDSATAVQVQKSDGTVILNVDTTNSRVGIGTTSFSSQLDVFGPPNTAGQSRRVVIINDTSSSAAGIGGGIAFGGQFTENNYSTLGGIQAVKTEGAGNRSGRLELLTTLMGETTCVRMVIDPEGAVGIGCTSPNAAALLQMDSTSRGFLPPRMTTQLRDYISNPPEGLIIYNTTTHKLQFHNGSTWGDV